jgi:hypothetical protein
MEIDGWHLKALHGGVLKIMTFGDDLCMLCLVDKI